eukprot:2580800-Rhodomonas_salina.1
MLCLYPLCAHTGFFCSKFGVSSRRCYCIAPVGPPEFERRDPIQDKLDHYPGVPEPQPPKSAPATKTGPSVTNHFMMQCTAPDFRGSGELTQCKQLQASLGDSNRLDMLNDGKVREGDRHSDRWPEPPKGSESMVQGGGSR